jgi:hydrophobic/amphiphilic exporter-1 (mainly G- bacteria), HAE1 family
MGVKLHDVFAPCRRTSARCTSTTSTSSAAPTRSACRPTRFRGDPDDIRRLEVRNRDGPDGAAGHAAGIGPRSGRPAVITATTCTRRPRSAGGPRGQLQRGAAAMEEIAADELPATMGFEWTGMAYQEKQVGGEAVWSSAGRAAGVPGPGRPLRELAVAVRGHPGRCRWVCSAWSRRSANIRGMDNNIYTQIGIVLIIALASKNAILIVEFARELRLQGRSIREAAVRPPGCGSGRSS